jgi:hypothetical protein
MNELRKPMIPSPHVKPPLAARRFALLVSAMVWIGAIAFGAYVAGRALTHWQGEREQVKHLVVGIANFVAGVSLLGATIQEWRHRVPLNANPRAKFGIACMLAGALAMLLLG